MRPSASATLAAASSNRSLRSSATPALAPAAPVKKPSPSPSIKRGKAEKLLKEHGSPPGMRVTAGGRIVPSDLPPVLNNRFANNAVNPPALRGIPLTGSMTGQQRADAACVPRLEVVGSRPVLYVGDRAYALPALDTTNATAPSLPSATLNSAPKPVGPVSTLSAQSSFTGAPLGPPRATTPTPYSGLDVVALRAQQTLKKQELRTVEQTEVLQASHQTDTWRAGIIEKKKNLIIELDALRKQITTLEGSENNNAPPTLSHGFSGSLGPASASLPTPSFVPHYQQPIPSPMYGYQGTPSYPSMLMFQPPFGGYPSMPVPDPAPFAQNTVQAPQSPGSASRRSHAIQIKPPPEGRKKQIISALDPKSPTYEPAMKTTTTTRNDVPPTPSPAKRSPWRTNGVSQSDHLGNRTLSQKPSLSSIDTTDFFPTNTHEHSSTRVAPQLAESRGTSNETSIPPSTPEKNWPASPWNEGNSSRSSHKAVTKLTSWPEAFGKQPSSGSLRQINTAQPSATVQDTFPLSSNEPVSSTMSGNVSGRKITDPNFGTEDIWPLVSSKAVNHVPSTYQEGFQAGYDHVGIPDSPEVLNGYIAGLFQFLKDESHKGRNASLRGLVANSQPHDSVNNMASSRTDTYFNSQENVRAVRVNTAADMHRDSAYPTPDSPIVYTLRNDSTQDTRRRSLVPNMYVNSAGSLDRVSPTYQQTIVSSIENDLRKKGSEKGSMSQAEAAMLGHTYRQFSGNQLTNRTHGTPVSLQRYAQGTKDRNMKSFGGDGSSFVRPMTHQRVSGLDGAMDDLTNLVSHVELNEAPRQQVRPSIPPPTAEGQSSTGASRSITSVEESASCFRPSSGKGKQKMAPSPVKSTFDERSDAQSSANTPGSPKKSGEHSPAKAKLEQVTNKFRRKKKDARNMSPEQKKERAKKWRERFGQLRDEEAKNIQDYKQSQQAGERR